MVPAVSELRQHRQATRRYVHGRRIQQRTVIREGDVVEIIVLVFGVKGAPAAVAALHADDPVGGAVDRRPGVFRAGPVEGEDDDRRVVHIGVVVVPVLKGPAAGL